MARKKAVPPAKTPEAEIVNPVSETAPEAPPAPPAPPQAEASVTPEPEPSVPPVIPDKEAAEPKTAPVPEGCPAIVTAAKGLNLREGPGFGFEVLTALKSGTLVLILDLPMGVKVPGWVLVDVDETAGWVSDKYLRALVD